MAVEKKLRALYRGKKLVIISVTEVVFMADGSYIVNGELPIRKGELFDWTTMVDQNGVEIYEGDIIDHCGFKDVVEWDGRGWSPFTFTPAEAKSSEVIGNIFIRPVPGVKSGV